MSDHTPAVPAIPNLIPDPTGPIPHPGAPFPEDGGSLIPSIGIPQIPRFPRFRSLRHGCWLMRYTPSGFFPWPGGSIHYDGTMRIERDGFTTTASGDLYTHRTSPFGGFGFPFPRPVREPDPGAGIPIFPRSAYRWYVRVTQILESFTIADRFTLGFELHSYNRQNNTWSNSGTYTAEMVWKQAPANFPNSDAYLEGTVMGPTGRPAGGLTMGWVSPYLRKATIELDRVATVNDAVGNGGGVDWADVGDSIGWDITVDNSDNNLAQPSGVSWSNAELHSAMIANRDRNNLDAEWRYVLLHVEGLDATSRGIMFDNGASDSNNIPREAAAIASNWRYPNGDPDFQNVAGARFGDVVGPYFRTAIHEIGHALSLVHRSDSSRFMTATNTVAVQGNGSFPNNILYEFDGRDVQRLRHWPDVVVRPGGVPWWSTNAQIISTPIALDDAGAADVGDHVNLSVTTLLDAVPLGAPVRVNLAMTNVTDEAIPVPVDLGLGGGATAGRVYGPAGDARDFRPLVVFDGTPECADVDTGEATYGSMTLLRGADGPLFTAPGLHRIEIDAVWEVNGVEVITYGSASVFITGVESAAHAANAKAVLDEPDLLLTLAIGGDHLDAGLAALDAAMACSVLAPHYAVTAAKNYGRHFGDRSGDLEKAAVCVDDSTVMSAHEAASLAGMYAGKQKKTKAKPAVKGLADVLKAQAAGYSLDDDSRGAIDDLG